MSDDMVFYNDKQIMKEHFRAFVHGVNGDKKLANSWDAYQAHLATGLWFEKPEDVPVKQSNVSDEEIAPEIAEKFRNLKKKGK